MIAKQISRRRALGFGCLGFLGPAGALAACGRRNVSARLSDVEVAHWGCQYQNINLAAIVKANLDLIVLDPIINDVAFSLQSHPELKVKPDGRRRLILAYMSVGEAESYRAYWRPEWRQAPPEWLGGENPRWPGSYAVRYWTPAWHHLLLGSGGACERIMNAGFDGLFLDRVDAYGDWAERGTEAQSEMVSLIAAISNKVKSAGKGLVLIAQNAEPLLMNESYLSSIDAVSKESLLYGLGGAGVQNSESDVKWSMQYLQIARSRGLPVFVIEYIDDAMTKFKAKAALRRWGFVPFFGKRLLDQVPSS
jgi:cysteinyl-tRNA synthetase